MTAFNRRLIALNTIIIAVCMVVIVTGCCSSADADRDPTEVCAKRGGLVDVSEDGVIVCEDGTTVKP